ARIRDQFYCVARIRILGSAAAIKDQRQVTGAVADDRGIKVPKPVRAKGHVEVGAAGCSIDNQGAKRADIAAAPIVTLGKRRNQLAILVNEFLSAAITYINQIGVCQLGRIWRCSISADRNSRLPDQSWSGQWAR